MIKRFPGDETEIQRCDCCGGDMPPNYIWEVNRDSADDCDRTIDGKGRCRAFSRDELWALDEEEDDDAQD